MAKTFKFFDEAEAAMRDHFRARAEARGISVKRIRPTHAAAYDSSPNTIHTYMWKGETVKIVQGAYDSVLIVEPC